MTHPPTPPSERCPTCDSDDPANRLWVGCATGKVKVAPHFGFGPCPDPFHSAPLPDPHLGAGPPPLEGDSVIDSGGLD